MIIPSRLYLGKTPETYFSAPAKCNLKGDDVSSVQAVLKYFLNGAVDFKVEGRKTIRQN